jgi:hypothetical protein
MKKKTTVDVIGQSEIILNDNLAKGYVSIRERLLEGIENISFEI